MCNSNSFSPFIFVQFFSSILAIFTIWLFSVQCVSACMCASVCGWLFLEPKTSSSFRFFCRMVDDSYSPWCVTPIIFVPYFTVNVPSYPLWRRSRMSYKLNVDEIAKYIDMYVCERERESICTYKKETMESEGRKSEMCDMLICSRKHM